MDAARQGQGADHRSLHAAGQPGASCLLCAVFAAIGGEPSRVIESLLLPGVLLTVIMGIFSPAVIREYQQFEFRKLAAEIFRRS
jgi:hypothetical protein